MVLARNPDPESSLGYLLRVPLGEGLVFRTSGTWPRTKALFCYPVALDEWPSEPEVVERVAVRACRRRGAAIDLVLDRGRENRSQIVFTRARGRDMVFWQSPRTRRQARPQVRTPSARAAGARDVGDLEVVVDSHERYPYRFARPGVRTVRRALRCGDYGVTHGGELVAAVERKSLPDLVSSLTTGKLNHALAELAALRRGAVVVEDRWSEVFKLERVRPAVVADGLAELQVRRPNVPIVFCETRQLAEEWAYRFLAAAHASARDDAEARARMGADDHPAGAGPSAPEPTTAEVRAWAVANGHDVPRAGRLRAGVWAAWRAAHPPADR
jgi:hypothetical protein